MSIISDKNEQAKLRQSGKILASCLIHLKNMLRLGVSAGELNKFALDFIAKNQATAPFLHYYGFPHALCTSINQQVVHGLSSDDKIIKEGDVVSLDLGVNFEGFITDSARTFLISKTGVVDTSDIYQSYSLPESSKQFFSATPTTATTENKLKLIVRTQESLDKAIRGLKAGSRVGDVGAIISQYINQFGYGNVTALGGHGVGRAVHESPYISNVGKKGQGALLVENMVIAIEPMITMGGGSVEFIADKKYGWDEVYTKDYSLASHFEDTILITKNGCENLTKITENELILIG